jgi:hypothetical protein
VRNAAISKVLEVAQMKEIKLQNPIGRKVRATLCMEVQLEENVRAPKYTNFMCLHTTPQLRVFSTSTSDGDD